MSLGVIIGAVGGMIILALSNSVINLYNITDETKAIASELMKAIALIVLFNLNGKNKKLFLY